MRAIALGIAGALFFVVEAFAQETPRSAASLECSRQADAQGLHGAERATFRSQCIASAGEPARQTTQQAVQPVASMTTQECAARYQAAQAAGTLAGRKWMEFRSAECSSANQPALKLIFPKGISAIYSQEPEGQARMQACVDQYNANKAANASGGMKWIEAGGGYYSVCNKHLKTVAQNLQPPVARAPINLPNGANNQAADITSLKRGTYVRKGTACEIASNSTIMNFDGLQFTQGRFCNAPVKGLRGSSIVVKRLCPSEDGSGEVTQEDTFKIKSADEFVLTNGAGEFAFRYCAQARLPEIWRNAVPEPATQNAHGKALADEKRDKDCMNTGVTCIIRCKDNVPCEDICRADLAFCKTGIVGQMKSGAFIAVEREKKEAEGRVEKQRKLDIEKARQSKQVPTASQSQVPTQVAAPPATAPLSQEEIDAFRKAILNWDPPLGAPALDVRIRLKQDGTIDGTPEVISKGAGGTYEVAKEAATRTVIQAQPFKMFRPESYDAWKDMIVTFEVPAAQAAQPPQDVQSVCSAKYEAAKAAGTIGAISREDFLRVCALSLYFRTPDRGAIRQLPDTAVPAPPDPTVFTDAFEFCRAAINKDSQEGMQDKRYVGPAVPPAVAKAMKDEAVWWRCMDGAIYACSTGASGSGCVQMSASKTPSSAVRSFCAQNPNSDFVPMSLVRSSSSTWKCNGDTPAIIQTYALDKRRYLKDSWHKIFP
jgi:hypothetical protein